MNRKIILLIITLLTQSTLMFPAKQPQYFYQEELNQLATIEAKIKSNYAQAFQELLLLLTKEKKIFGDNFLKKQITNTQEKIHEVPAWIQRLWHNPKDVAAKEEIAIEAVRSLAEKIKNALKKNKNNNTDRCKKHQPTGRLLITKINEYLKEIRKENKKLQIKDISQLIIQLEQEKDDYNKLLQHPLKENLDINPESLEKKFENVCNKILEIKKTTIQQKQEITNLHNHWNEEYINWCEQNLYQSTLKIVTTLQKNIKTALLIINSLEPISAAAITTAYNEVKKTQENLNKKIKNDQEKEKRIKEIKKELSKLITTSEEYDYIKAEKEILKKLNALIQRCNKYEHHEIDIDEFNEATLQKEIAQLKEQIKKLKIKNSTLSETKKEIKKIIQEKNFYGSKETLAAEVKLHKLLEKCSKFEKNKATIKNFDTKRIKKSIEEIQLKISENNKENEKIKKEINKIAEENPENKIVQKITTQILKLCEFNKPVPTKEFIAEAQNLKSVIKEIETLLPKNLILENLKFEPEIEQKEYLLRLHTYKNELIVQLEKLLNFLIKNKPETIIDQHFLQADRHNEKILYIRLLKIRGEILLEKNQDKKKHPLFTLLENELKTCAHYITIENPSLVSIFSEEQRKYRNIINDYHQKLFTAIEVASWLFDKKIINFTQEVQHDFTQEKNQFITYMLSIAATFDSLEKHQKSTGNLPTKEVTQKFYKKLQLTKNLPTWIPAEIFDLSADKTKEVKEELLIKIPRISKENPIIKNQLKQAFVSQLWKKEKNKIKEIPENFLDYDILFNEEQCAQACPKEPKIGNSLNQSANEVIKKIIDLNPTDEKKFKEQKQALLFEVHAQQEAAEFIGQYLSKNNAHIAAYIFLSYYEHCRETKSTELLKTVFNVLKSVLKTSRSFPESEALLIEFKEHPKKVRIAILSALESAFDEKQIEEIIAYIGTLLSGTQDQEIIYKRYLELFKKNPISQQTNSISQFSNAAKIIPPNWKAYILLGLLPHTFKSINFIKNIGNPTGGWFINNRFWLWKTASQAGEKFGLFHPPRQGLKECIHVMHQDKKDKIITEKTVCNAAQWSFKKPFSPIKKILDYFCTKKTGAIPPLKINFTSTRQTLFPKSKGVSKENIQETHSILKQLQKEIVALEKPAHRFANWNDAKITLLNQINTADGPSTELSYSLTKFKNYLMEQQRTETLWMTQESATYLISLSLEIATLIRMKNVKHIKKLVNKLISFTEAAINWDQKTKQEAAINYGAFFQWCSENNYEPANTEITHADIAPMLKESCQNNNEQVETALLCTTVEELSNLKEMLQTETEACTNTDCTNIQTKINEAYRNIQKPWWQQHIIELTIGSSCTAIALAAGTYYLGKKNAQSSEKKQIKMLTNILQHYHSKEPLKKTLTLNTINLSN